MSFEVEHFEWPGSGDRLELAGRWYDVRGRRFLRPTLDVEIEGDRRRLLALLEHKPWAAEEGEDWLAAFAWEGDSAGVGAAHLTVSTDLTIELDAPRRPGAARGKRRAARPDPRIRRLTGAVDAARAELAEAEQTAERLRQQLAAARAEFDERLGAARAELAASRAELEAAREAAAVQRTELEAERDEARAANAAVRDERDRMAAQRDGAVETAHRGALERDTASAGSGRARARRRIGGARQGARGAQLLALSGAPRRLSARRRARRARPRGIGARRRPSGA